MRARRPGLGTSLAVTLLVWLLFSWPLPRHIPSAIPASHRAPATESARFMIPGDHLQLLYHFWLAGDMLAGRTPLFQNPYEFNDGDDDARREPGPYYAPFSLLYALLAIFGSRAAAWNLTGLISLWLTAWFTWHLAARRTSCPAMRALAALVAVALPYRWVSWFGGSPTGLAMAWVPLLALGLDDAVARGRTAGGLWAGLALISAAAGDAHTFFFAALSVPLWCLLGALIAPPTFRTLATWLRQRVIALLPFALAALVALALSRSAAGDIHASAVKARPLSEVALFSPTYSGLFGRATDGVSDQIMIGWGLASLLLLISFFMWKSLSERADRVPRVLSYLLLAVTVLGIIVLALGPHGPYEGLALRAVRRLIPPYRLIRQPAKIYALLPTVAAFAVATAWPSGWWPRRPQLGRAATAAVAILLLIEYRPLMRPWLCFLRPTQGAYAAAADAAHQAAETPRALVLPLWPGDSHYASVYQYYASLYRIRLVNGYRPFVPARYLHEVFERWESLNQGEASDEQLDALLARGIRHVLFHEDLFPEKVSPFPAGATLARLFAHSRLQFIARDGPVFAFQIQPRHAPPAEPPKWTKHFAGYFPAWFWNPSAMVAQSQGGLELPWLVLSDRSAGFTARRALRVARFPDLHWRMLTRGTGSYFFEYSPEAAQRVHVHSSSEAWDWTSLRSEWPGTIVTIQPRLGWVRGRVEVWRLHLAADIPLPPSSEDGWRWPASWFFRPGWSDPSRGTVVFEPLEVPSDDIFYGPRYPLAAGDYEAILYAQAEASPGEVIGWLRLENQRRDEEIPVRAGAPARLRFGLPTSDLFSVRFRYAGRHRITLEALELIRGGADRSD